MYGVTTACVELACALLATSGDATAETEKGPVTLSATYTGETWANVRGGLRRGTRYLDNLDVTIEVDASRALGWSGATIFLYGLYNNDATLSDELVGDVQTVSNIDTNRAVRLYEAWIDQRLLSDRLSLRLGLYDLNSEFDTTDSRGLFINSSHGIGPDFSQTGRNGPSIFPVTSLSFRAEYKPNDNWLVRAAVIDGVPGDPERPARTAIKLGDGDGALVVAELNYLTGGSKLGVGYWRYTSRFERFALTPNEQDKRRGNDGFYFLAEQRLSRRADGEGGLVAFARIGWADAAFNPIHRYVGAGAVYTGPVAKRPDDQLGIAVGWVEFGRPYRRASGLAGGLSGPREVTTELTYRAAINDWLTLQPNLQYVFNPGGDTSLKDAAVAGLRFEIGF